MGEEITMAAESLKPATTISRIYRTMDVTRTSIYRRRLERSGKRYPRTQKNIKADIIRLSGEITRDGYRRIWALIRNSGTHVNIETCWMIMRRNSLALPYARHKNRTRRKDLKNPENVKGLLKTDINYFITVCDGIANRIQ